MAIHIPLGEPLSEFLGVHLQNIANYWKGEQRIMGTHKNERNKRILWFQDARFGMFIHWGLYSIPARGEWIQSVEKISTEEYEKYAQHFKPDFFDPSEWARLAKRAGMKYAVFTAKHHDGFAFSIAKPQI